MNPARKLIHSMMQITGLDSRIDAAKVNKWIEQRRARNAATLLAHEGNAWISRIIVEGHPAAIGKIGDRECCALSKRLGLRQFYKYTWCPPSYGEADLYRQAGVFPPSNEVFKQFSDLFLERLQDLDGCGTWGNPGEHRILHRQCPKAVRFDLPSLDPYLHNQPWSMSLENKRVLVVHPFETSIREQYAQRKCLWPQNPDVLPEFELDTLRSPYGFSRNNFKDWFAMLDWLQDKVATRFKTHPFDVALIGCGGAGLPLATFVKQLGAVGIHMGGPTQLLFGIRGKRWDSRPDYAALYNEHWVRPHPHETPPESRDVDQSGYW